MDVGKGVKQGWRSKKRMGQEMIRGFGIDPRGMLGDEKTTHEDGLDLP